MTGPRRIIANLDCEEAWAAEGAAGGEGGPRRRGLPGRVAGRLAAAATLLRAFAEAGDRLWTPRPVADRQMVAAPWLPRPHLESGPAAALPAAAATLAWGETAEVSRLRRLGPPPGQGGMPPGALQRLPVRELVWRLPAPPPEVAARVNHRLFALELARRLGCALPGARAVATVEELEGHLAAGGAAASPDGSWVVKAPLAAAGRARVVVRGGVPTPAQKGAVRRLFQRHGSLLFEPWMPRLADFGCTAVVTPAGVRLLGDHRLLTDSWGGFRGIGLSAGTGWVPDLEEAEAEALRGAAEAVARALYAEGYMGPFGIDAWRYRDGAGKVAFQPLGEINARLTFGIVARALAEGWAAAGRMPDGGLRLRLDLSGRSSARPAAEVVPLVAPVDENPTAAWLEPG